MHVAAALSDASTLQFALACIAALLASVLGGLAGYGTGLVLPVFLAPVVGIANVIPVMAVAMLMNNASRVVAFRRDIRWPHVRRLLVLGLPACAAGAYCYTLLSARWVAVLLGGFLLASVPLRRVLARVRRDLGPAGERAAGAMFGFLNGGMTGAGVILISILMAAGVAGPALIATDAIVSVVMGLAKVALFGGLSALTTDLAVIGILVGLWTIPGAFLARRLLRHFSAAAHAWLMEAAVIVGAAALLWRGAR